jgi:phosphatidylethanolamine/phosphatidyl-N-methylethanolamine N-methyltransferase
MVRTICSDAFDFARCLPPGKVAAVVSGLPLLHVPPARRMALLKTALALQGTDKRFIQLSYSWSPPIAPRRGMVLKKTIVWKNFPPAHVWTYRAAPG